MKYVPYLVIGLVIVAVTFVYFWPRDGAKTQPAETQLAETQFTSNQPTNQPPNPVQWETKSDEQQPVAITTTPVELSSNAPIWKFDISFDTHSGSLDDDPLTVITLSDDTGNEYQPTAWEGPGPGGHHREGILLFTAIRPMPAYVQLNIKNVGGIPERSLQWNLQ